VTVLAIRLWNWEDLLKTRQEATKLVIILRTGFTELESSEEDDGALMHIIGVNDQTATDIVCVFALYMMDALEEEGNSKNMGWISLPEVEKP